MPFQAVPISSKWMSAVLTYCVRDSPLDEYSRQALARVNCR